MKNQQPIMNFHGTRSRDGRPGFEGFVCRGFLPRESEAVVLVRTRQLCPSSDISENFTISPLRGGWGSGCADDSGMTSGAILNGFKREKTGKATDSEMIKA